jgi:hypothetical protein
MDGIFNVSDVSVEAECESILGALRGRGMVMSFGRDFRQLQKMIEGQPLRHGLLRQFDPDGDLPLADDALWICGHDSFGDLVFTQAVQLFDLTGSSVAEFINGNRFKYFPNRPKVIGSSVKTTAGPKASRLTGLVVYHGEMWLHPEFRDGGAAHLIVRLGMMRAVIEWNPAAIFGLMDWSLACAGFNNRIGYMHSEPMAVSWERCADKKSHQVWVVYAELEDIHFMLELSAVEFANVITNKFH